MVRIGLLFLCVMLFVADQVLYAGLDGAETAERVHELQILRSVCEAGIMAALLAALSPARFAPVYLWVLRAAVLVTGIASALANIYNSLLPGTLGGNIFTLLPFPIFVIAAVPAAATVIASLFVDADAAVRQRRRRGAHPAPPGRF